MNNKSKRIVRAVICDILLVAVMLCTFAAFHHVIPTIKAQKLVEEASAKREAEQQAEAVQTETEPEAASETEEVSAAETGAEPAAAETETVEPETVEATPEPTPDTRTEWQIKFADKFSDEIEVGDNYYRSPNVSITVTKVETEIGSEYGFGNWPVIYYVADIYVASLENFRTYTAGNILAANIRADMDDMDAESNALLSLSGDFFSVNSYNYGFVVRNGVTFVDNSSYNNICVLFNDGTMETYKSGSYDVEELEAKGVYQVWSFGPPLLDSEGHAISGVSSTVPTVNQQNPRSAIGYYEPGHYCFVMVEGRDTSSKGMILAMLADVFEDLGCQRAYNLDGGGSAMIYFDHNLISNQSNGDRQISDILCIVESGEAVDGPDVN